LKRLRPSKKYKNLILSSDGDKRPSLPQKVVGFYEAESGLAVGLVLKAKHENPAKSFERFKNQTFFFF
jgi:hypothetical protein